jgi:hypothetical protein
MKKRILTLTVILAALAAVVIAATPQSEQEIGPRNGTIRFVVIGDRTGGHMPGVYEQAIAEIARLHPDFSVTVGDQIEGYSTDSVEVAGQWREYDSIVKQLPSPLHITPGNHDITYDQMEPWYRLYAGKPYYSFDQLGSHFIVLDVSRWEFGDPLPEAEMDWLIDDLKHNQLAAHTFVFFHKPYWIVSLERTNPIPCTNCLSATELMSCSTVTTMNTSAASVTEFCTPRSEAQAQRPRRCQTVSSIISPG